MKRESITKQGDSRWTITSGARTLPASAEMPVATDLPARRPVRIAVRRRNYEEIRSGLPSLSRLSAFDDN